MRYLAIARAKRGGLTNRLERQFTYEFPESMTVEAEYWLKDDDACAVVVFQTDNLSAMTDALAAWEDVLSIAVYPVITAEEGLRQLRHQAEEPLLVFG